MALLWTYVEEGIPAHTVQIRATAGCLTPSGRPPSVFRYLIARNDKREGALSISLEVALAVAGSLSVSGSTGMG